VHTTLTSGLYPTCSSQSKGFYPNDEGTRDHIGRGRVAISEGEPEEKSQLDCEERDATRMMVHTGAIAQSGSVLPLNGRRRDEENHHDGYATRTTRVSVAR
jgi:hypothetical protein